MAILIPAIAFTACSDDDDEPEKIIEITVKTDGTQSIQGFHNITAITPNDFVATIKGNTVYGKHEGIFETKCTSDEGNLTLKVTVEALHTLFVDLRFFIGMPKCEVEKIFGQPTKINDKGTCTYNPYLPGALEENYQISYENDKVEIIAIQFKYEYYNNLIDHLTDRYAPVAMENKSALFIDAYKVEDSKYGVLMQWNSSYIIAMYMPTEGLKETNSRSAGYLICENNNLFDICK